LSTSLSCRRLPCNTWDTARPILFQQNLFIK
jgi:hypothetical protein